MSEDHRHGGRQCKEIFARLSEYIDHELPDDLCERIEGHMDGCPPCQAFLESLERTVKLVEDQTAPAMPEEVRESVREAWRRCRDDSG
jgi:RNA polymerase sigma-70 factor (ECF subfamily)